MRVIESVKHFDVRGIPSTAWHLDVMRAFERLGEGDGLLLESCHELRPLRIRLEQAHPGQFLWSESLTGTRHWITRVQRFPAPLAGMTDLLRRSPLFTKVSAETPRTLCAGSLERTCTYEHVVVEQECSWEWMGFVKAGKIAALVTSPDGREHTLHESLAYESFGELPAIDGGTSALRFVVKSETAGVFLFRRSAVQAALAKDPVFSRSLNALLAQRIRLLVDRYAAQATLPTIARVAAALLPHTPAGPGLQTIVGSVREITHRELATAAGTVKEVVCRVLSELEDDCAIQRSKGRIVRANRERLMAYAQLQPAYA